MHVAFIFRGDISRHQSGPRNQIDALMCYNNWKSALFDDIVSAGSTYEIIFITYDSPILNEAKLNFNPTYCEIQPERSQTANFQRVLNYVNLNKNNFDRFVILRFDIMYKIRLTSWPKWTEKGIFLFNKDVHYNTRKLYSDIIFIFDSNTTDTVCQLKGIYYNSTIHNFGRALEENGVSFHLLYDSYYHILSNPLFVIGSIQKEPDLNNYIRDYEEILDVSPWN